MTLQDPDVEQKRKAELMKIKTQNKKFKDKIQQTIQQKQEKSGQKKAQSSAKTKKEAS